MGRLRAPIQPIWYSIVIGVISIIALVVAGVVYTGSAIQENNYRLCGVIAASLGLDGNPETPLPPTSSRGARVAAEMVKLYEEYRCEEAGLPPVLGTPPVVEPQPTATATTGPD